MLFFITLGKGNDSINTSRFSSCTCVTIMHLYTPPPHINNNSCLGDIGEGVSTSTQGYIKLPHNLGCYIIIEWLCLVIRSQNPPSVMFETKIARVVASNINCEILNKIHCEHHFFIAFII
jgi:hypothetical protein